MRETFVKQKGEGGENSFGCKPSRPPTQSCSRASKTFEIVNMGNETTNNTFLFSMEDMEMTAQQRSERKMYRRIRKHRERNTVKIESDISALKDLLSELGDDDELMVVSNSIDCPSLIYAFVERIEECYIGTWAVTPAGIAALETLGKSDACKMAVMLMDTTHSYKWIFSSGTYEVLSDKVHIRFNANHSKFVCMKMTDGTFLNFIGSMNLSNNPRWENCLINRRGGDFEFFRDFCTTVEAKELRYGKTKNTR